MIIVIRLIILILVFNNFRLMSNKLNIEAIIKIFMEIKRVSYFLVKVILGIVLFLFLNYNSYVYYRLGLRIMYGYVFIYAFLLVLMG
jgi:hypothetical protein